MEWKWSAIDEGRVARARKIKLLDYQEDGSSCSASTVGSSGEVYRFTPETCTCHDFALNHGKQPCKHMIRLAMEAGILNEAGRTPEEQRLYEISETREQIARAAGFFYVFHEPVLSDREYDQLKEKLLRLTER